MENIGGCLNKTERAKPDQPRDVTRAGNPPNPRCGQGPHNALCRVAELRRVQQVCLPEVFRVEPRVDPCDARSRDYDVAVWQ